MSGKRFEYDKGEFTDTTTGEIPFHGGYACDLLNRQAEDLEVLRKWIQVCPINDDFETIDDFERKMIRLQSQGCCVGMDTRVELAKRRIAALDDLGTAPRV